MSRKRTAVLVRTTRTDAKKVLVYEPETKRERKIATIRKKMESLDRTSAEYSRLGWMVSVASAFQCGNEILGRMAL